MDHWERVRRYRDLASRAIEKAENTADETQRATYFHMAAAWHQLKECRAMAAKALLPEIRAHLLQMADRWEELARQRAVHSDIYWDMDTSGITDPSKGAGNIANDPGIAGVTEWLL